jgi:hypothetical protein
MNREFTLHQMYPFFHADDSEAAPGGCVEANSRIVDRQVNAPGASAQP